MTFKVLPPDCRERTVYQKSGVGAFMVGDLCLSVRETNGVLTLYDIQSDSLYRAVIWDTDGNNAAGSLMALAHFKPADETRSSLTDCK